MGWEHKFSNPISWLLCSTWKVNIPPRRVVGHMPTTQLGSMKADLNGTWWKYGENVMIVICFLVNFGAEKLGSNTFITGPRRYRKMKEK